MTVLKCNAMFRKRLKDDPELAERVRKFREQVEREFREFVDATPHQLSITVPLSSPLPYVLDGTWRKRVFGE